MAVMEELTKGGCCCNYSLARLVTAKLVYWMFPVGGFRLKVRGRRCDRQEAPLVALAPHSSFFDALTMVYMSGPSIVAKGETSAIPFFGSRCLLTTSFIRFKQQFGCLLWVLKREGCSVKINGTN